MNKDSIVNGDIYSSWIKSFDGTPHKIYSPMDFATLVYDNMTYYKYEQEYWRKEAERLKTEARQEVKNEYAEENTQLKEKLQLSYGSFDYPEEMKRYKAFEKRHIDSCRRTKYTGSQCPYVIVNGTGVGTLYKVVCPVCGEEEDITHVESW